MTPSGVVAFHHFCSDVRVYPLLELRLTSVGLFLAKVHNDDFVICIVRDYRLFKLILHMATFVKDVTLVHLLLNIRVRIQNLQLKSTMMPLPLLIQCPFSLLLDSHLLLLLFRQIP